MRSKVRIILILFLLLSITRLNAGMCPCEFGGKSKIRRNESGIGILNTFGEQGFYRTQSNIQQYQLFGSVHYKYHFNSFSLRGSLFIRPYAFNDKKTKGFFFTHNDAAERYSTGKSLYAELRTGLEKTILSSLRSSLFSGVDLIAGYGNSKGDIMASGQIESSYRCRIRYAGIGLFLGYKYRFSEKWSLNIEPGYSLTRCSQQQSSITKQYSKHYFALNSLSINFHF